MKKLYAHSPPDGNWGKAHLLKEHLKSVAELARKNAEPFDLDDLAYVAGFIHDFGKASDGFQKYIGNPEFQVNNCVGKWVDHKFASINSFHTNNCFIELCIAGHHNGLKSIEDTIGKLKSKKISIKGKEVEIPCIDKRQFYSEEEIKDFENKTKGIDNKGPVYLEILTRFLFSALVDADYIDTESYYLSNNNRQNVYNLHDNIEGLLDKFNAFYKEEYSGSINGPLVNDIRKKVYETCLKAAEKEKGVFELYVPTGGGKTISSMAFALNHALKHGLRRIIVVIPYTSIIEQNAKVYSEIFGNENVLEHHSNFDSTSDEWSHRYRYIVDNWNCPIIVTTNVQFLESLHSNKPSKCRKLHNIANSVIIFDESQTMPVDLLDVTLASLRVLVEDFGCTIVSCTATQPYLGGRQKIDGAIISKGIGEIVKIIEDDTLFKSLYDRVKVNWLKDCDAPTTYKSLSDELREHDKVLVITHRRLDSYKLAKFASEYDEDVLHLSAAMLPEHRLQVINEIKLKLSNNKTCRVVSTQIVEAGVDIDFPVVYRAFAGLDSICQSMGRCNREGKLEKGQFYVFLAETDPPFGILREGFDITKKCYLESSPDFKNKETYTKYYKKLYERSNTGKLIDKRNKGFIKFDFEDFAQKYRIINDEYNMPLVVPWLGLDELTLKIIKDIQDGNIQLSRGIMKSLCRATINVSKSSIKELLISGGVKKYNELYVLENMEYYNEKYGFTYYKEYEDDYIV